MSPTPPDMNPAPPTPAPAHGHPAHAGVGLDDVLYTLFRHKWLILGFVCLGVLAAGAVRILRPPPYLSKAKVMVRYILSTKAVTPSPKENDIVSMEGQNILNSEQEILTSLDVAKQVVQTLGPETILAHWGGGTNRLLAAGIVCSGVEVENPPGTSILIVTYKHPDPDTVQPVLEALIATYQRKHLEVREGWEQDSYYQQKLEEERTKLTNAEEVLKELKSKAKVLFLDDTKRFYQNQITKAQEDLLTAERELAERKAVLGDTGQPDSTSGTNVAATGVPASVLSDYGEIADDLESARKHKRELLRQYKEAFPLVETVNSQINRLTEQKIKLEQKYPSLVHLGTATVRGGTNAAGMDIASEMTEIRRLTARVRILGTTLSNIQTEAARVLDIEPKMAEAQRQRDEAQERYNRILGAIERKHSDEIRPSDQMINMSVVQSPTPPKPDMKKLLKLMGVAFGACAGLGFGLAFLLDLVLLRTIKRSADVERHLRLPVFLAIPDMAWGGWLGLPWGRNRQRDTQATSTQQNGETITAVVPWRSEDALQSFTEGLRERLMTYFQVRNLDLKKPKLVALTGCDNGTGVTTLASGLAATLSTTGGGNVLLVDMKGDQGVMRSFSQGKPSLGLDQALEPEVRAEAQVQENLYLASLKTGTNDKLAKVVPNTFSHLVPRIKASDYDYVIFDMPPVTPTSPTPRLASHMDIVLMVLESERTTQRTAARASALMRDARANVAVVLNKCRVHGPEQFAPEM